MLRHLGTPEWNRFRCHDLCRGHSADLLRSRAPLAVSLAAGEWRSKAFLDYLPDQELERDAIVETIKLDSDSGSDDEQARPCKAKRRRGARKKSPRHVRIHEVCGHSPALQLLRAAWLAMGAIATHAHRPRSSDAFRVGTLAPERRSQALGRLRCLFAATSRLCRVAQRCRA